MTPMLIVLIAATLLAFLASQSLPQIFAASPAMWAHVALAVGVMTLITAAMQHFVPVLARTRGAGKWMARLPFLMLLAGAVVVASFAGVLPFYVVMVAAFLGLLAAGLMVYWMWKRARQALGKPHPGLNWYVAAMLCLGLGLAAALMIPLLPAWHAALRAFHWHINLYGFVGITAVGTLQVLMPTAAGVPDSHAALRLRQDLKWAVLGALGLAAGAALANVAGAGNDLSGLANPLSQAFLWLGLAAWFWVLGRMLLAWFRLIAHRLRALHGAEPILLVAVLGFMAAMLGTVLGRFDPLSLFLPAFLMPLVTGAAGVLAPVWLRPAQAALHVAGREALNRWAGVRALMFSLAAVLPWFDLQCTSMSAIVALFWFGALFFAWLWRST